MKVRVLFVLAAIASLLALLGPSVAAPYAAASGPTTVPILFPSPNYAAAKAALDAVAPRNGGATNANPSAPTPFLAWAGQGHGSGVTPSDSNGAIGPDGYVEVVNELNGAYTRAGALINNSTEASWTGLPNTGGDPVVMYSAPDQRFYATMLSYTSLSGGQIDWGFSKTSHASVANADWCWYQSNFGRYATVFPDYPKLGDTADFLLFGINAFGNNGTVFLGGDVAWVTKPPVGSIGTCPAQSSFKLGVKAGLKNGAGSTHIDAPNPAKQADSSHTGYVVVGDDVSGGGSSTAITVYKVKKNKLTGNAKIAKATTVTVPSYTLPPNAPQMGTTRLLDTLDGRIMSAWTSIDPSHGGVMTLWTGHTVKSARGASEYRWYEINPATPALLQSGAINDSSLYVFMGASTSDRNGATGQFGSNGAFTVDTSSSTAFEAVNVVSVVGGIQSGIVTVATSPTFESDFSCNPVCRWGDYSGASPDPAATSAGQVWGTGMLAGSGSPGWATENFGALP